MKFNYTKTQLLQYLNQSGYFPTPKTLNSWLPHALIPPSQTKFTERDLKKIVTFAYLRSLNPKPTPLLYVSNLLIEEIRSWP